MADSPFADTPSPFADTPSAGSDVSPFADTPQTFSPQQRMNDKLQQQRDMAIKRAAPDGVDLLSRIYGAAKGGIEDTVSEYPAALKAGAEAVGAGLPAMGKAAVQPARNMAAFGNRILENAVGGGEMENPEDIQKIEAGAQKLEQPLPGAAGGWQGTLAQAPAQIGTMLVSPEAAAAQQLQQGGNVTLPNAFNAAATMAFGHNAIPVSGPIAGAAVGGGTTAIGNVLSGQPIQNNVLPNAFMGALGGAAHGGEESSPSLPAEVQRPSPFADMPSGTQNAAPTEAPLPSAPILKSLQPADQQAIQDMATRMAKVDRNAPIGQQAPEPPPMPKGTIESPPQRRAGDLPPEAEQRIKALEDKLKQVDVNEPSPQYRRLSDISPEDTKMLTEQGRFESPEKAVGMSPQQIAETRAQASLAKAPEFQNVPHTEGATAPGEIGFKNREAPEVAPTPFKQPESIKGQETAPFADEEMENLAAQQNPEIVPPIKGMAPAPESHVQDLAEEARQEQQRQAQNAVAVEKHPGGLGDMLKSWWTGRKTASAAAADWQQHAGPALAKLDQLSENAPSVNTPEGRAAIDQFEKTGSGFGAETDTALKQFNQEAKQEAEKAGTDTSAWNQNWIKRLARKPEGMSDATYQGKLGGAENYLKGRSQPTFEDFHQAITKQGLEPAYDNALHMQMAGLSEVHRSAAIGKQIQQMLKDGNAVNLKEGETVPHGFDTVKDLIGQHGENIAVPKGTAYAWRNILDRSSGDLQSLFNSMKRIRYVTDTMLARRAISGGISDLLTSQSPNKLRNLQTAFLVSAHPELLTEPEFASADKSFKDAARSSGYKNGEFPLHPPQEKTLPQKFFDLVSTVPRIINKRVTEPFRGMALLNASDEANTHPEWSDAERKRYMDSAVDTINRNIGGEHEPTGLPPTLDKALGIISPYWRFKTAAIRQGANAVQELGKGNFGPAAKGAIGIMISHALQNAIAQMVETKWNTGHAIAPNSLQDLMMHRTGEKNPDGSEKRANIMSSLMPLESAAYEIAHGEAGKAAQTYLDPAAERIAESVTGRDYQGQPMTPLQRAKNVGGAFTFPPHVTDDQGNFAPGGILNQLSGERPAPKAAERSSAQNYLNDVLGQNVHEAGESPEVAAKWQKWSQLASTPEQFRQNGLQLYQQMSTDPDVTPKQITAAFKRWQTPAGLERSVLSPEVGPADLQTAYHLATDEEKAQMKPGISRRIADLDFEGKSRDEIQAWVSLIRSMKQP